MNKENKLICLYAYIIVTEVEAINLGEPEANIRGVGGRRRRGNDETIH